MSRRPAVKGIIKYTLSGRKTARRRNTKRNKTRTLPKINRRTFGQLQQRRSKGRGNRPTKLKPVHLNKSSNRRRLISPGDRCRYRLPKDNNNNASKSRLRLFGNKRRKCLLRTDGVLYRLPNFPGAYRLSPRPTETVVATFHQRTARKGMSSEYRGFQCTSMALAAILIAKVLPVNSWSTPDMDAILRYGDMLHEDLLLRRTKRLSDPRIALHEIPTGEENKYEVPVPILRQNWYSREYEQRKVFYLTPSEEFYGLVHPSKYGLIKQHSDLGYTPLEDAVGKIFEQNLDGIVLTVGDISGSVLKDLNGKVRYFDSHCNNKWGRLCLDGTAVLVTFDNIADFVRLIRKREPRVNYRYELIGLKIHQVLEE